MNTTLLQAMRNQAPEFVGLRRDLHRHPELGLAEVRTSQVIADCLQAWGYEVHRGLATTGVVGTLRRGLGSKRLGLRAHGRVADPGNHRPRLGQRA